MEMRSYSALLGGDLAASFSFLSCSSLGGPAIVVSSDIMVAL